MAGKHFLLPDIVNNNGNDASKSQSPVNQPLSERQQKKTLGDGVYVGEYEMSPQHQKMLIAL